MSTIPTTILSLDISTKTGWALLEVNSTEKPYVILKQYGVLNITNKDRIDYKHFSIRSLEAMIGAAIEKSNLVGKLIDRFNPTRIVIEQTNKGRSRWSQKLLEWMHLMILLTIDKKTMQWPYFIDTSRWRSILGVTMTKDDRKHNKLVKLKKVRGKITPKHLAVRQVNDWFGLDFKQKDNDIADAILIGTAHAREICHEIL